MSVSVNVKTLRRVVTELIQIKEKVSITPFIWGKHGIGKTTIVKKIAEELGYDCEVLNFANIPIEDATGFPDGKGGYYPPNWFHQNNSKPVIYYCDEINRAPKYVLQGLFNFILDGRIHTHRIGPKDLIIAAGNPDDDRYETTAFEDPAFISRFAHFYLEPSSDEYVAYLQDVKSPSFVINSVKLFDHKYSNTVDAQYRVKTEPDNRAFDKIGMFYKSVSSATFKDIGHYVVSAMVGIDAATVIMQEFKKSGDIPKIEDLIMMKVEDYPFTAEELDKLAIINTSLVKKIIETEISTKTFEFAFDSKKAKNTEMNEGIRRYFDFIPKDFRYAVIQQLKEYDEAHKDDNNAGNQSLKMFGLGDTEMFAELIKKYDERKKEDNKDTEDED